MKAKMQMLDNYITKYEFSIKRKIASNEGISIKINMGCKLLKPEEKEDKIIVGIDLRSDILLINVEDQSELGKINVSIRGIFMFDKSIDDEEMEKLLKTNGTAILYQQLRAYINANTALSSSIPNIILPIVNFKEIDL